MKTILRCLLPLVLLSASGCMSAFDLRKNIPWGEGTLEAPQKVNVIWTDTIMQSPNNPPMRGFGGRLTFFDCEGADPQKVEGMLVVYAFDESRRDPANAVPDRKYVFNADQFKQHYSKSKAGNSYSFWIPWDEAGGEAKQITLLCRFTPKKGPNIASEQIKQLLPGKAPLISETSLKTKTSETSVVDEHGQVTGGVTQTSYNQPVSSAAATNTDTPSGSGTTTNITTADPRKMQTSTIALPARFGQRAPTSDVSAESLQLAALYGAAQNNAQQNQPQQSANKAGVTGANSASAPGQQPLSRFAPSRSRVLGAPLVPPERGHEGLPPRRVESQSPPGSTP